MTTAEGAADDQLYGRVVAILDGGRKDIARSVNTAMVRSYWMVGREIVLVEQMGERRAGYGESVLARLSARLQSEYGRGFSATNLRQMRRFFLAFPNGSAVTQIQQAPPAELPAPIQQVSPAGSGEVGHAQQFRAFPPGLSWAHYLVLMRLPRVEARAFYEIEAAREAWSSAELERQIGALVFERLARQRTSEQILQLAHGGQQVTRPTDVIKDPFVLEFLELSERPALRERDLEQSIIDRLETFMLELGKGFCFVARQKRLTVEADHFYVDLVFYNRLLRCFVLVDLKLGKLTHQDLGQMQMYVNYFDRTQRVEHESPTVGIVLCSDQNAAMVKITLPADNQQIMAATYRTYLPTEAELEAELEREREAVERVLRLTSGPVGPGAGGDGGRAP